MTNIYNLFKFLEDKEGKKPNPSTAFKLKLLHTPEDLTPEDLNIKGSINWQFAKITSLPDNLKVEGFLNLSNTPITSLPDNLQVGESLDLSGTKITSLPDNLEVGGNLDLSDTKITSLPNNLKVGGDLYLRNTPIIALPDNLQVGKIDISGVQTLTPSEIPKNLHKKIRWHFMTFADFEEYTNLSTIPVPGLSKPVKGYKVELETLKDLPGFEKISNSLPELTKLLKNQPIKNLELYKIYKPMIGGVRPFALVLIQLPELPSPLIYEYQIEKNYGNDRGQIRYKSKKMQVSTFEQDLKARGLEVALGRLVPGYKTQEIPKYLQNEKGKPLRLSQIIDREQKPVSMDLGTRKRGGLGVEGQYDDYALAFSQTAQTSLAALAKKLDVKWGDFIAYRFGGNGDANYVIKGEGPDGKVYYVNRYGSGQGGTVKLYDKEFKQV